MELHTNDLSINSEKTLRERLIENFKIIQRSLGNLDNLDTEIAKQINQQIADTQRSLDQQIADTQRSLDQQIADTQRSLDQSIADWSERVKHIVLGTDPETIELVVTKILEGKGLT